jgi:hypothetical protein
MSGDYAIRSDSIRGIIVSESEQNDYLLVSHSGHNYNIVVSQSGRITNSQPGRR